MDVLDVASPETAVARHRAARGRRRWPVVLGAAATVALLAAWYAGSRPAAAPHDPRAYPGSQTQDLPGTLGRYRLSLPACADASARYHRVAQWEADSLYLHFTGDRHCMNQFLITNGLFAYGARTGSGLPFDGRATDGFGWPRDPRRQYRSFTGRSGTASATLVDYEVALYESGEAAEVYLHAGIV